jgi:hypothetical protein
MYKAEFDRSELFYVCRFSPGGDSEEDFRRHFEGERAAGEAARATPDRLVVIIVMDPGAPLPNAAQRQAVAEITSAPWYRPTTAAVSKNTLLRGIMTAVGWLRPRKNKESIFPDVKSAIEWIEKEQGRTVPGLRAAAARIGSVDDGTPRRAAG